MSGEKGGEEGNGLPRLKSDSVKLQISTRPRQENDVVNTRNDATRGTNSTIASAAPQPTLVQEYTVNIPLVRPKATFLKILRSVGAAGEVFTKKEICFFLKEYIGSRLLYDPNDPRVVHCQNDELGGVFEMDSFTINDVLSLLDKHCTTMPDTCIKRRRRILSPSTQHQNRQLMYRAQQGTQSGLYHGGAPNLAVSISVCTPSIISSTTTTDYQSSCTAPNPDTPSQSHSQSQATAEGERSSRKRARGKSSSESDGRPSKRRTSLSIHGDMEAASYPWYFRLQMEASDDSEVLSVQGRETAVVKDSSDDLWFVEEDRISVQIDTDDTFSVEYEVESDEESDRVSGVSDISSDSNQDVLLVCADSDVEFWADYSASNSSHSDEELTDADKWKCLECDDLNPPVQRFCGRCWKLRPGWLPELRNPSFRRSMSAPGGLSSSDSERAPSKPRRQRSGRNARSSNVREPSHLMSYPTPSSFLSSRRLNPPSTRLNQSNSASTRLNQSNPASTRLNQSMCSTAMSGASPDPITFDDTPRSLAHYDSGISMGLFSSFSSSQGSLKSASLSSPHVPTNTEKCTVNSERTKEIGVRTTLSNFQCNNELDTAAANQAMVSSDNINKGVNSVHLTEAKGGNPVPPTEEKTESELGLSGLSQSSLSEQFKDLCMICLSKPKNACIIHGKTSHQVCCYRCAKTLKKRGKSCPGCRRPIKHVTINYLI